MSRPAGFVEIRQGADICWLREDALSTLSSDLFEPSFWQARNAVTGTATGRGITWFVRDGERELVLRHYRRGGLFGRLVKDLYAGLNPGNSRAMRELMLLAEMRAQGLPVPEPIGARLRRVGPFYRADLLIGRITSATDLLAILQAGPLSAGQWQQIGSMIGRFHAAGIDHTDLNIHNILLDRDGQSWLIDFDKCGRRAPGGWQQANLARLLRSLEKEKRLHPGMHWEPPHWTMLTDGYRRPVIK
ncbi:MAG: 3-deoxy-D-manno-octulosonic acid kinase [Alcanivoracaceae bacterium]|jgi:3-deoxy-D-manno-octulosonic acid kinase|nr:3-deoxy-D-manno-octulosonic acid kinase [Alcanivoracaceae bacterium]